MVVVGAGAAGLAAAITLGRYGIPTLLIERREVPSSWPRATVISTRSMELIRSWGLEGEVLAGGVDADLWLWECATLAEAGAGTARSVGYPSRAQATVVSPTSPGTVPQDWLEGVLRDHLRSLPSVRCEFGAELVDVHNSPDAVAATMQRRSGETQRTRAQYLVAADGAHSAARGLIGVEMYEREGAYGGVQVVFRAPLWDLLGELRYALYAVTTPEAPGVFLPAGRPDRWVYGGARPSEDGRAPGADRTELVRWMRLGAGVDFVPGIERIGPFHSPGQIASRFRVDRTFLVGDAAHRVTPRGGTGLNTALQDGHDLGWKLAWVLQGWADPSLLDSYEAERRVVAEHNLIRSTDVDGSRRPVLDELNVDLGGRIRHAWLPATSTPTSTLDLLGPGWTLFTGPSATLPADVPLPSPAPATVRALDPMTARTLGIGLGGTLLVRPDGVPVEIGPDVRHDADADRLPVSTEPTRQLVET